MSSEKTLCLNIGNQNPIMAVNNSGDISIVLNKISSRTTPTFFCFTKENRLFGPYAESLSVPHEKTTAYNLKTNLDSTQEIELNNEHFLTLSSEALKINVLF